MKLFSKSNPGAPSRAAASPTFQPIDRVNLLALLDRIVGQGEACVVRLREPRGVWTYAFQGGGLIHAGGGTVRGARQAFDLLWEFQQGEVNVSPGTDPGLSSNLYIDKARLIEMIRRSQGALHGPGSPYIPPDQQRPIAPVNRPWPPPGQPGTPPPGWSPAPYPQAYPAAAPPGYPAAQPGYPAPPSPYPAAPPGYPAQYPAPYPGQPGVQPHAPQPQPPQPWPGYPAQGQPPSGYPTQGPPAPPQPYPPMAAQPMAPPQPPMPATPARMAPPPARPQPRPTTPHSFSVPPMPLPKPRGTVSLPGHPGPPQTAPPAAAPPPVATPSMPAGPVTPVDELKTLRATLVSQAPATPAAGAPPNWNVRGPGGAVAPPPTRVSGNRAKGAKGANAPKRPGRLRSWARVRLISFLLWACERRYSPDDHWTVKDAFEVATLELRDQFFGAFSQSFQSPKSQKGAPDEFEGDQIASGRTRGRTRGRRR